MKFQMATLLFCAVLLAQEDRAELDRARELEAKAEELLDAGRRAEAFELLARAAKLREEARAGGKRRPAPPRAAADRALERFEKALGEGDMVASRAAAREAHANLARWARELARREAAPRAAPTAPETRLLERLERLEVQARELRAAVERMR